ncbi:hypothetical protein B0H13DRAFT_1866128 [Mycena leptocephala]|nr:hypothetical protein B0H13DRAFT_1866128 [Mycena leptocephala]
MKPPQAQRELHYSTNQEVLDHLSALSEERRRQFVALLDGVGFDEQNDDEDFDGQAMDIDDDQLRHEMNQPKRKDTRRRRDVTQRRVLGFRGQMKAITNAYIKWAASQGTYIIHAPLHKTDEFVVSSLIAQGLFPCSPFAPKLAVTTRVLEMFRVGQPPSLPFTVNPELGEEPELGRDRPDWQLKNCCPACTYKLEGEEKLIFSMLLAMEGNDSLKRILQKDKTFDEEGNATRAELRADRGDLEACWKPAVHGVEVHLHKFGVQMSVAFTQLLYYFVQIDTGREA